MRRIVGLVVVVALTSLLPRVTQAQEKPKLAVMTIQDQSGGLPAKLMDALTEHLRTRIASSGVCIVIDRSRQAESLRKMVREERKESHADCRDAACQIPLGRILSADSILRTTIVQIGSTYHINAEIIDLATEATSHAAQAGLAATPEEGQEERLLAAIQIVVSHLTRLMGSGAGNAVELGTEGKYGVVSTEVHHASGGSDGVVRFESVPTRAWVEVDGRRLPRVTPTEDFVEVGMHKVRVLGGAGFEPFLEDVYLKADQTLKVTLKPITGTILVRPRDPAGRLIRDVTVLLDGKAVAKAPVRLNGVRVGTRKLQLVTAKLSSPEQSILVAQGRVASIEVVLKPRLGTLFVDKATVRDARYDTREAVRVVVDGRQQGIAPIELQLPPGPHKVEILSRFNCENTYNLTVVERETVRLQPQLSPGRSAEWEALIQARARAERTRKLKKYERDLAKWEVDTKSVRSRRFKSQLAAWGLILSGGITAGGLVALAQMDPHEATSMIVAGSISGGVLVGTGILFLALGPTVPPAPRRPDFALQRGSEWSPSDPVSGATHTSGWTVSAAWTW